MKARVLTLIGFLAATVLFLSCQKNTQSKVPHIFLLATAPRDSMHITDTFFIEFTFTDGDGDLAYNHPASGTDSSQIYIKDSRFDTAGFEQNEFPLVDISIEDPKKGISGTCLFSPARRPQPRSDSLHSATGDTLYYEFYIMDRAGHQSNHIVTPSFVIRY